MIDVIIAKYNEDIKWINNLSSNFNPIIYNKGGNGDGIKLNNVGRESDTYIYHILNNYYNLSEWNIFCQGDPFPHCSRFVKFINEFNYNDKNKLIHPLGDFIYTSDDNGSPHHTGLPIKRYCDELNLPNSNIFLFPPGAQFIVHKDLILKHKFEFWLKCSRIHHETVAPWIFERLWLTIFT